MKILGFSILKSCFRKVSSELGKIKKISLFQKENHVVIDFYDTSSVARLRDSDKEYEIDGSPLLFLLDFDESHSEFSNESSHHGDSVKHKYSKQEFKSLYIGNIPAYAVDNEILQLFSGYGKIENLTIKSMRNHPEKFGFITFEKSQSACNVLCNGLLGFIIYDGLYRLKIGRVIKNSTNMS